MKNTVEVKPGAPKTISTRDLKTGQYALVHYGGEGVIAVKTVFGGVVGLDGHHTWSGNPDLQCTLLAQGKVITIVAGEQI